jgi:AcrR family transcriptional regulator
MGRSRASQAAGRRSAHTTRDRIVDAALETIKQQGILGASARAIARTGGFNEPLIFYHFRTLDQLLLAAVDKVNATRLAGYTPRLEAASTLAELVAVGAEIYDEDRREGHITVLIQTLAGFAASPELSRALLERFMPWMRLLEDTLTRVTRGTPLEGILPAEDTAFALTAWFVGMELLSHPDSPARWQELLARMQLVAAQLPAGGQPAPQR